MTTAVLQARCPQCKRDLRIPGAWVERPLRCKHCKALVQARPRIAAPPAPDQITAQAPNLYQANTVPVSAPVAPQTGVTAAIPLPVPDVQPVPDFVPVTPAMSPVAPSPLLPPPVAIPQPIDPFAVDDSLPDAPVIRRPQRIAAWKMLVVSLLILGCAGGAAYVAVAMWPDGKPPVLVSNTTQTQPTTTTPGTGGGPGATAPFPRRALVISVHNYLYANPTSFGQMKDGKPDPSQRNLDTFLGRLSHRGSFAVSPAQIVHLSDFARKGKTAPTKVVIEKTIEEFLNTTRDQDRILLVFVGHAVEIEDVPYLVPIEGELDDAKTLIPLKWVYDKLEPCKARQKVLILDTCRFSPARGQERPGGDPMGEKFDEALKNPPKGVQVWTACVAGQRSYEFEQEPINNGLFMDCLHEAVGKGVQGKIQKPSDPFPIEELAKMVNQRMKDEIEALKLQQTSRLTGTEPEEGAAFDPDAKPAEKPVVVLGPKGAEGEADRLVVELILKEIHVPPIKAAREEGQQLPADALPPFSAKKLDDYPVDNSETPLRKAVEEARVLLWAVSPNPTPADLKDAVQAFRKKENLNSDLSVMRESYLAPDDENKFKLEVTKDGQQVTRMIRIFDEGLTKLTKIKESPDYENAPKRWKTHFDFVYARVQAQAAYIWEYASALGRIRGELPPRDPKLHRGWRLASQQKLTGDATGKRLAREANKSLLTLSEEAAETPWAVLSKRERLTHLGLDWQAEK